MKLHISPKVAMKPSMGVVLLVSGEKGNAFRLGQKLAPKDGSNQRYQLIQNNVGLPYKGAVIDLTKLDKLDAQGRLELGTYIAGRGKRPKVEVLSQRDALKLARFNAEVLRGTGSKRKPVSLKVASLETQYAASIEQLANGRQHFFQLETKLISGRNERHYGSFVKTAKQQPKAATKTVAKSGPVKPKAK